MEVAKKKIKQYKQKFQEDWLLKPEFRDWLRKDKKSDTMTERQLWQGQDELSRVALELVFAWLNGAELARAGAVCRDWRLAAACPSLWRRLLSAYAPLSRKALLAIRRADGEVKWRQLYVEAVAGWKPVGRLQPSSVGLLHAALCPQGKRLALFASDATISIWERSGEESLTEVWVERWCACMRDRGWASAERGEWAAEGTRLLAAGAKALLDHDTWELLVLSDVDTGWQEGARARTSAGVAGCWADAEGVAFLSFELRSLAPGLAATTVWLNSASQEMQSEYAGVTSPVLRIFNESGQLLRAAVAEVPLDEEASRWQTMKSDDDEEVYTQATSAAHGSTQLRVLVVQWGRGGAGAVGAWVLTERRPPPLVAAVAGDLRARFSRHRAALAAPLPPQPEHEPTEEEVRALCTPPDAVCPLPALPVGLVVHPNGRCVWACWSGGGGACLSLPMLRPLRALACGSAGVPSLGLDHYAQPTASHCYFAAPSGGMSGAVHVWSVKVRGRRADSTPVLLAERAPALAALLVPRARASPDTLLVLTPDYINVWRSKSTLQPCLESSIFRNS